MSVGGKAFSVALSVNFYFMQIMLMWTS